jgi:hypothetical protein
MKTVRIIPSLDIKGPNLVKGIHLEGLRVLGKPADFPKYYYEQGADELMFMDVVPSLYESNSLHDIISGIAKKIFIPITVGGGIRTIIDIKNILRSSAEYCRDIKNAFKPTRDYKLDYNKHYFSGLEPVALVKYGVSENDLKPYMPPSNEVLEKNETEIHFYGYYKKWVPQENYYYCVDNTGFEANPVRNEGTYSKYASLDDKIDGFQYYLAYIKFGLGRCTSDAAHEIREGHITREEGIVLINKFDGEFPEKYFKTFLEYCDIIEEFFWEVVESWRSDHLWIKETYGDWKLRHTVNKDGNDDI